MTEPLVQGLRVLEWGSAVSTSFCGKLLAEAGLDVVLAEPAGGHALRRTGDGVDFHYLAGAKRSVTVDPADPASWMPLVAGADLLLHSLTEQGAARAGLDFAALCAVNPRLVVTAITPYGSTGPDADQMASELTVYARSGHLFLTGLPDRKPLLPFGDQPSLFAGLAAAHASLAALLQAGQDGTPHFVEVAATETLASALDTTLNALHYRGIVRGRHGNRLVDQSPLTDIYRTRDGFFLICIYTEPQWRGFCEMLGRADWLADPALASTTLRAAQGSMLEAAIASWFADRTSAEALNTCQRFRLPSCIAASVPQLLADPQLAARDHFATVPFSEGRAVRTPKLPFVLSTGASREGPAPAQAAESAAVRTAWQKRPAPPAAGTAQPKLPLQGVRVLDVTHAWAGPFGGLQLGFLGADMLKIEGARRPDGTRYVSADARGLSPRHETGGYFHEWNRNKRAVALNVDTEEGRALMMALVAESDVLLNNHSARVLPGWGLDWPALHARNPRLVLVTMPAFGSQGPYSAFVGYGETLEGAGGLARLSGYEPGAPVRSGVAYPDPAVGHFGALAAMIGLAHRAQTGSGVWLDVSHQECVLHLIGGAVLRYQLTGTEQEPGGNARAGLPFNDVLPCQGSDEWVAVTAADAMQWQALCAQAGVPGVSPGVDAYLHLAAWTQSRPKHEAAASLRAAGLAAAPVLKPGELETDAQFVARGFFQDVMHSVVGPKPHPRPGFRLHGSDTGTRFAAPLFDSSTDDVLRTLLHKTQAEIAALREAGVIGGTPAGSLVSS